MDLPILGQSDTQAAKSGVTLSPLAADKVRALLVERGTPSLGLRLGVRGGGCSGNSYFMEFCEADGVTAGDDVFDSHGVRVVVDRKSLALLGGTEVDFVEGLMGSGFKFNNPNVRHNCACGESFSA